MTKTYSEISQEILFKAARDMRKLAGEVLNDCVEAAALLKHEWTKNTAAFYARLANELEEQGHSRCIASARLENGLRKSHDAYSQAIDAYEERRRSAAFLHEGAAR